MKCNEGNWPHPLTRPPKGGVGGWSQLVGWLVVCLLLLHQLPISTLLNLLITQSACHIDFVIREATFEVDNFTVTLKGEDVGTDTVEEPTVVADDNSTNSLRLPTDSLFLHLFCLLALSNERRLPPLSSQKR